MKNSKREYLKKCENLKNNVVEVFNYFTIRLNENRDSQSNLYALSIVCKMLDLLAGSNLINLETHKTRSQEMIDLFESNKKELKARGEKDD